MQTSHIIQLFVSFVRPTNTTKLNSVVNNKRDKVYSNIVRLWNNASFGNTILPEGRS